jgi:hypothetical protein
MRIYLDLKNGRVRVKLSGYLDDLLGGQYDVEEALVLGPYLTKGFFEQLIAFSTSRKKTIPRARLTLLADDGWDQRQLDEIQRLYLSRPRGPCKPDVVIHRVAAPNSSGLVHAKILFLTLKNKASTYTKRILLIGSANASEQGFGVHSETFINVDIADIDLNERRQLLNYLDALKNGVTANYMWFSVGRASWVSVPAVVVVKSTSLSGFDAWLRRGRLCHKYQSDPAFGHLALRLKKPLPPRNFESNLYLEGFGSETDSQVFSRRYVGAVDSNDETRTLWREQYFVETYYGHWTGTECFNDLEDTFFASRANERANVIGALQVDAPESRRSWLDEYEEALRRFVASASEREVGSLDGFFEEVNGEIDFASYRNRANGKISGDVALSKDEGFSARYVAGYSFPRVPQLGDDFEEFALDWCRSVLNKIHRRKVRNKLVSSIRGELDRTLAGMPQSSEELLGWLRVHWQEICIGITSYHKAL